MAAPLSETTAFGVTVLGRRQEHNHAIDLPCTGHTLWPVANNLCEFLHRHAADLAGARAVLELGTGLGLCGLVAARLLRPALLVVTDMDEPALELCAANVERNGLAGAVRCHRHVWGTPLALPDAPAAGFDLVFGSDLIYIEASVGPLFATVAAALRPPSAGAEAGAEPAFVMSFARRGVPLDDLFRCAQAHGLQGRVLEDFTTDLFGEACNTESDFWAGTVLRFGWAAAQNLSGGSS